MNASYWVIWDDRISNDGRHHRQVFRDTKELTRFSAGIKASEFHAQMPRKFRVLDKDGELRFGGYSETVSKAPLEWDSRSCIGGSIEYQGKDGTWVQI